MWHPVIAVMEAAELEKGYRNEDEGLDTCSCGGFPICGAYCSVDCQCDEHDWARLER